MKITELLDQAKNRANLPSDYALAKVLGLSAGNMSNIRKGKAHPSNEVAVKLATLAGLEEMRVIAEIELRTANTPKKKEFWQHYIESRGVAACLGMTALAASIILTPEPAEASILHLKDYGTKLANFHAQKTAEIYIMRKKQNENRLILKALISKWIQLIKPHNLSHNNNLIKPIGGTF